MSEDNDSPDNWKFSSEDVTSVNAGPSAESVTDGNPSSVLNTVDSNDIILLPLLVAAVYSFVETAAVLTAVETLIGSGVLASAITEAMFIAGAVVVAGFALLAVFGVACIVVGVVRRVPILIVIGILIGVLFVGMWAGASFAFGEFPLFVGAILTLNVIIYGTALISLFSRGIKVILMVG